MDDLRGNDGRPPHRQPMGGADELTSLAPKEGRSRESSEYSSRIEWLGRSHDASRDEAGDSSPRYVAGHVAR
jgi:hypothetical protein